MRRLSKLGIGILFATGLGMAASPAFAQSPDIHHDRRDIRHDRRDILSDRQDIHNKRADVHNDYQTLNQDRATLRNDVKNGVSSDQVTADRQAVHNQVKDIRADQRGVLHNQFVIRWPGVRVPPPALRHLERRAEVGPERVDVLEPDRQPQQPDRDAVALPAVAALHRRVRRRRGSSRS